MSTLFGKKKKKDATDDNKRKRIDDNGDDEDDVDQVKSLTSTSTSNMMESSSKNPILHKTDCDEEGNDDDGRYLALDELGLMEPLVTTCRQLGFHKPTPVQRRLIPFLIKNRHESVLAIAATGTGKTAAYVLPILHHLSTDPYGIYAVILTPTRELAQQIHQQVLALGSSGAKVKSVLVMGGLDAVRQSCLLDQQRPHFVVATPGRLATLLRGPHPPRMSHVRYLVLDEADRLLASGDCNCGFERDVAELVLHCRPEGRRDPCQTLLFSATVSASLQTLEEMAGGNRRLPLRKFIIRQDGEVVVDGNDTKKKFKNKLNSNDNESATASNDDSEDETSDSESETNALTTAEGVGAKIPNGLQQEYVFMPARVRDAYLLATVRTLLANGGRSEQDEKKEAKKQKKQRHHRGGKGKEIPQPKQAADDNGDDPEAFKAKSAILFVSTCQRAALVSGILEHVGVANVALHSLLSQHRRLAALGKFQSEQVRILVATDVAARGLDIPHTDLVINVELPRNPVNYVHRVGRTARAGRRGRAVSLVAESDISLVHAAERASGRELVKCLAVTDEIAVTMLGPAAKAARLTKLKLADIGFDELLQKFKERKVRDRKERQRRERRFGN